MINKQADYEKTLRARSLVLILEEGKRPRVEVAAALREIATSLRKQGDRVGASLYKRAAQQAERGWA